LATLNPPEPSGSARWKSYESARFSADGTARYVKLDAGSGTMPAQMQSAWEFRQELEFVFHGFTSGSPTEQVLVRSGAWSLAIVNNGGVPVLRGKVDGASNGQVTTGAIESGRWYRLTWTFDKAPYNNQVIAITPWNWATGFYDNPQSCWVRGISWTSLNSIGAVTFGGREGFGSATLNGRIDNVSLWNYRAGVLGNTSMCTTVTQ